MMACRSYPSLTLPASGPTATDVLPPTPATRRASKRQCEGSPSRSSTAARPGTRASPNGLGYPLRSCVTTLTRDTGRSIGPTATVAGISTTLSTPDLPQHCWPRSTKIPPQSSGVRYNPAAPSRHVTRQANGRPASTDHRRRTARCAASRRLGRPAAARKPRQARASGTELADHGVGSRPSGREAGHPSRHPRSGGPHGRRPDRATLKKTLRRRQ